MVVPRLVLLLVALTLAAALGTATAAAPAVSSPGVCAEPNAARELGEIEKARDAYLDIIVKDQTAPCAARGLALVRAATRAEERHCKIGAALAAAEKVEQAQKQYVAALVRNGSSACAIKGLGGGAEADDSEKSDIEKTEGDVTAIAKIVGTVAVGVLVVLGLLLLIVTALRRRRASLSIEAFGDGAVDAKVGRLVAGLVRKRLNELSRRKERSSDSYQLDVVVADLELLAENESLEKALGGLAEVSQFKLAVAVFALIDRLSGKKRLVVTGDLAPAGSEGAGVILALHSQKMGLRAQGAIWAPPPPPAAVEVVEVDEDEDVQVETGKDDDAKDDDPTDFYGLAGQASAWVQYEAARSLDRRVEAITKSALSFSLMCQGLAAQRTGKLSAAAELYAEALAVDRENVAALVNLSVIFARYRGLYLASLLLLIKASEVLAFHYEATSE